MREQHNGGEARAAATRRQWAVRLYAPQLLRLNDIADDK